MSADGGAPGFESYRLSPFAGTGEGCFWGVVVMLWGFAAFILAVTPGSWPAAALLLALGLGPLVVGLKVRRTRLRYEAAELEVTATARLGGRLEGVLHLPHEVADDARVRADLVCQRDGGPDSPDPVLGRSYGYGSPLPREAAGTGRFPLRLDIPASGLASGHDGAYWTLHVVAEAGFRGLDVAFRVTVEG